MGYTLAKPFSDVARADFVCEHQGLNYYEDDNCIIMYPNTEKIVNGKIVDISTSPEYLAQQLEVKRAEKLEECTQKAYDFIQNKALFEKSPTQHIEATDGNIGKFSAFMAGFNGGMIESVPWSTYENENITLNFGEAMTVLQGLLEVQADVWTVKHNAFIVQINNAQTIEELNAIAIDYEGV